MVMVILVKIKNELKKAGNGLFIIFNVARNHKVHSSKQEVQRK